ncbi:MAG TPA: hypothetical protein VG326_14130 [Tepidisphaeraceae bacterium]|jgi:hypothetical protein|nr:hypothetical protein [Tepidisphaeraceae bacterium]
MQQKRITALGISPIVYAIELNLPLCDAMSEMFAGVFGVKT